MSPSLKQRLAIPVASVLTALCVTCVEPGGARAAGAPSVSVGDSLALTVYLPIRNQAAAEAAAQAIQTPGDPSYHHFLTVADFVSLYADSDTQIAQVEAILRNYGFTIQYVYANHMAIEVTSPVNAASSAFGVSLRKFTVNGRSGTASTRSQQVPAFLLGLIRGVGGFDTLTRAHPMHAGRASAAAPRTLSGSLVGGTPGNYLPADFEKFYDVAPIYKQGITGRGSTIGIVTLNNFHSADAYAFWKQIGLNVSQTRVTKVEIDGGLTASTNNIDGEGETDLDVEQSGAIAPAAKLRVYIAPNITDANFINGFEAAASENLADTVSTSWGEPELDYFYNVATRTPAETFQLEAYHDAFLEMALQGQTLFVASGDSGSFDTVEGCPTHGTPAADAPTCNAPYSVDHPASDPLVTAAGGTTRPFSLTTSSGIVLSVAQERAWAWDYIPAEAAAQGKGSAYSIAEYFSVGGGGGVSSYWGEAWYQRGIKGITSTKPGQSFMQDDGSGSVLQVVLPSGFAGRNMPDISTNADPESGYQYIQDGAVSNFYGGTSFVAPQLNGVTALFVQAFGGGLAGRVGQISPALYQLSDISTNDNEVGDNWGYKAVAGYDNAVGLGTLDAAKLLAGLVLLKSLR